VPQDSSITIGFVGSKVGAIDNAWREVGNASSTGDKREGWWCATDFRLLFHPVYRLSVTPNQWHTICLPYAFDIPEGMHVYELAGLLADQQAVALSEVSETEAGCPYVYTIDQESAILFEYGETADRQTRNCLRGYLSTTNRAPAGSYVLTDGQWQLVGSNRPNIAPYTAIIYKPETMTTLASWEGPVIPLVSGTNAVDAVTAPDAQSPSRYRIDGQPASRPRGVYIEQQSGQSRKKLAH